jgi:hypothetical protein
MRNRRMVMSSLLSLFFAAGLVSVPVAHAQSDGFVSRANAATAGIPDARRSDLVLLPALAKSAATPASVRDIHRARVLPANAADFAAVATWAKAPEQQAVIDGLRKVTEETDWKKAFVFAQPYGVDGVSADLIRAKLYTELGDPPTLAAAQHMYMPAIERLEILANVETTRLASEGKVDDALELMLRMTLFGRQFADRKFYVEADWGMHAMMRSLERIRDIAYVDFRTGGKKLDLAKLRTIIDRLSPSANKDIKGSGYPDITRLTLPDADRIAAEQVIERVYEPKGGVKPDVFARTMAKVGTAGRPLRLFSESARWRGAAQSQVNQEEASRLLAGVYNDWGQRFQLNWFDRFQAIEQKYTQLDRAKTMAFSSIPDVSQIRTLRQLARVELGGTRSSLAALAFTYRNNTFPPSIASPRPQWTHEVDVDPFNTGAADTFTKPAFNYFRPTIDGGKDKEKGVESVIVAQVPDPANATFTLTFKQEAMLIYSVGSDNANNVVKNVQNTPVVVRGADYLVWPPVLSLYRQHLVDLEVLK